MIIENGCWCGQSRQRKGAGAHQRAISEAEKSSPLQDFLLVACLVSILSPPSHSNVNFPGLQPEGGESTMASEPFEGEPTEREEVVEFLNEVDGYVPTVTLSFPAAIAVFSPP